MRQATARPAILYLTVDGVLQPLGYSQICRPLLGLARRGFRYKLLSMESRADLANPARVGELQAELAGAGIDWAYLPYDPAGNARAAGLNLVKLAGKAGQLVLRGDVGLIHARAYHAALVARALKRSLRVPYLFDARGRWIDERLLGGRWFTNPLVERGARVVERSLYGNASALVVLTQLHADDIRAGDFGKQDGKRIEVVTTCADFESFALTPRFSRDAQSPIPAPLLERLADKLVLGFVGSTNAFYRHRESFQLAREVMERRPDAELLVISAQQREFTELAREARIPEQRITVTSVNHKAMPGWLQRIDWAIQLLNGGVAKRGSMPTKLAEFLATGVRPIHFGCNDEVAEWVRRTASGIVLESLEPRQLATAAEVVARSARDRPQLEHARDVAKPHFDLASGLDRYESVLRELGMPA
jgi:hypothetical protein